MQPKNPNFTSTTTATTTTTTSSPSSKLSDYYLAGRNLSVFSLALSLVATQLGGGAIVGSAEAAYRYGFSAIYYIAGISCGLMILAMGLGAKFRQMQVTTIPEIFSKIYSSQILRVISSLVLIISMFGILLSLGIATRSFIYAMGISFANYLYIGFWSLVIAYTSFGGFKFVVKMEILQISFILTMIVVTSIFIISNPAIDIVAVFTNNSAFPAFLSSTQNSNSVPWSSWFLMPMLFTVIGQDMGQRCFAAKNPGTVTIATLIAAMVLLLSVLLPIGLGMLAAQQQLPMNGSQMLVQLVAEYSNEYVSIMFAIAILLAILSTADAILNAISANISCDILSGINISNTNTNIAKLVTIGVGGLAIVLSFSADGILDNMVQAYNLAVAVLFVPIVMAAFTKYPCWISSGLAMLTGAISFIVVEHVVEKFTSESALLQILPILLSLIIYLFSKKLRQKSI